MRIMRLVCFMSMCVSHLTVGNIIPTWAGINSSITSDTCVQLKLNDAIKNVINELNPHTLLTITREIAKMALRGFKLNK